jgi:pyruvate kinase
LRQLLAAIEEFEKQQEEQFAQIPDSHVASARNLSHYLALRQHDLRPLQSQLSRYGLSSLGRMEARVEGTLMTLERLLSVLVDGDSGDKLQPCHHGVDAPTTLEHRTRAILGPEPTHRRVRVMVTLPSEAAMDPMLSEQLLRQGMDAARINCAHDDTRAWVQMVRHVREASAKVGKSCVILCDLPGPKLRTGVLEAGPCVVKWKPTRNALGHVEEPATVVLSSAGSGAHGDPNVKTLPVQREITSEAQPGDVVRLEDARGRFRTLTVVGSDPRGVRLEGKRTAYVTAGTPLDLLRNGVVVSRGVVGELPALDAPLRLFYGDTLCVAWGAGPGHPARNGKPATVTCELIEVFEAVRAGQRILFDDGKLEGVITRTEERRFYVELRRVGNGGSKLAAEKGINLPDTELNLPALGARDLEALDFAAQHADCVGLSFVHDPMDIRRLQAELELRGAGHLGKVSKIETARAFERLPSLLLAGLQHPPLAVMVARGDLAVEVGFERLAEVQEEILWLCEAAHVPVIWATQVLESLTKQGWPSRAEVTDAAMSGRAEAVMLNKGPHVGESVKFLSNVLERMQEHQHKKSAMLRKLRVSRL